MLGGFGNDTIDGGNDDDEIDGGHGDDLITDPIGHDVIRGGLGNDDIQAGEGDDEVFGGDGDDTIAGDDGNDLLVGGPGRDIIGGGDGDDIASGNEGDDKVGGEAGNDQLSGDEGDDVLTGGLGDDVVDGNEGDDTIQGDEGEDTLSGGDGDDAIDGNDGDDLILGDDGDDTIDGGLGCDTINGGAGVDNITGDDTCDVISATVARFGTDEDTSFVISDFELAGDGLNLTEVDPVSTLGVPLSIAGDGTITYDPTTVPLINTLAANQNVADSFAFFVSDSDGQPQRLQAIVTVEGVNDVPENLSLLGTSVSESSQTGTVVGVLGITEIDAGDHVTFRLLDDANGRFAVNGNRLVVADALALDIENEAQHTVVVEAVDRQGASTQEAFTITIQNENERPFAIELASEPTLENSFGATIGSITVFDNDPNEFFSFEVSDPRFEVVGGELKLLDNVALDFEQGPFVTLDVEATDSGGLSFTETFTFAVLDVNEFAPQITLSSFAIQENPSAAAAVGTVVASDADLGQTLTYQLLNGNDAFAIDPGTGRITVRDRAAFNFETNTTLELTVEVTDSGTPAQSTTATITVQIQDVNEAHVGVELLDANATENIDGMPVGRVNVLDEDGGGTYVYTVGDPRFEVVDQVLRLKPGSFLRLRDGVDVSLDVVVTDSEFPTMTVTSSLSFPVQPNGAPWRNPILPEDVNRDGIVSARDALVIINQLERGVSYPSGELGILVEARPFASTLPFYDPTGNGFVSAVDALIVINYLDAQDLLRSSGSSEPTAANTARVNSTSDGNRDVALERLNAGAPVLGQDAKRKAISNHEVDQVVLQVDLGEPKATNAEDWLIPGSVPRSPLSDSDNAISEEEDEVLEMLAADVASRRVF